MKVNSLLLAALTFGICSFAEAADTWMEAEELLRQAVKMVDPTSSSSTSDDFPRDGTLYLPMDYYPEQEKRLYASFWKDKATDWHNTVYKLLSESSDDHDNIEATYTLAQLHLWGYYGFPHNKTLAFKYTEKVNELTKFTNSSVLFDLAVMHSTGLFGAIPIDNVKGLLYFQRSAWLGDLRAKQALAYRHYSGVNVPRDCNKALLLYREIADEVRHSYSDHEWNVLVPYVESYNVRLPDFSDGLLGRGLNSMTLSTKRIASARPDITSSFLTQMNGGQVVLQFGSGGSAGAFSNADDDSEDRLVDIYYTAWDDYKGTYTKSRDIGTARTLLEMTYRGYDSEVPYMDNLQRYFYGKCLDLLGHMYFTGEGLESPDINLAEKYLKRSINVIESSSSVRCRANIDLGLINQYIYGNETEAIRYYKRVEASRSNDGTVDFQLAKLTERYPELNLGDPFVLMQTSYLNGYRPAIYEFARMTEQGINNRFSCDDTAYLFKRFIEENEGLMAPHLKTAYTELLKGNSEVSLWAYSQAAEQGYESAQVSAAYLLYQIPYNFEEPPRTLPERKLMAISYYTRAFKQDNIDAGVVAADIYYKMGNFSKALNMYQSASLKFSPQAIWNIGYMYENGLGVDQDFHLAKRYYDQVLENNPKLYFSVKLSVLKLRLKSWLIWMTGGKIKYGKGKEDETKNVSEAWYRQLIRSFKKAGKENAGVPDDIDRNTRQRARAQVAEAERQPQDQERNNDIWETLEAWGLQVEDIMTIAFVLFIFFFSLIIRTLAARRGWNIRNNGMRLQINGRQQAQAGGNFDIQIFAI